MAALVSFGVQKLLNRLSREYEQFQGVEDQLIELTRELNLLSSFLQDADAKKHTSAVVRNCLEEIKEIIFDAEDIIETFLLKEKLRMASGIKNRIIRLSCIIPYRIHIASDIGGISKRTTKVIRDMESFKVQQIIADARYMQPLHDRQKEQQTFSRDNESGIVALEETVNDLVRYLVEDKFQLVSITGMGGLGKAALARQVFNHVDIKHHFDKLAWVRFSQEFTCKRACQTILRNLRPSLEEDKILQMAEDTLLGELYRLLKGRKSLIVFVDIWKNQDWELINSIFPPNKDWKVLLTSRTEITGRSSQYINFRPQPLSDQDSWTLFLRTAFPGKDAPELMFDEEMEMMGKQMIKHCGGLPLAVKVLGGLLAANYTLLDWKRLSKNIGSRIMGARDECLYNVLSFSFEELPIYLKQCFFYLARFQEDSDIDVEKLSYHWAAEGIQISRDYDGETIRDVADGCIEELVKRNFVISQRDMTTLRFETCHLHSMMREVCLIKAEEENFLQIVGTYSSTAHSQSHCTSRRLVLQSPTTLNFQRDIKNPKLRSLAIVRNFQRGWMLSDISFTRLQLLRLLDLSGAEFKGMKLPSSIGKLIHLRYLSLEGAKISHLPSSLKNLTLLSYLNLDVDVVNVFVPNVFMGMQELRYLALPRYKLHTTELRLSKLANLETLKHFSTANCSLGDLHGMPRLRTLSILVNGETNVENLSASIAALRDLQNLNIEDLRCKRSMVTEECDNDEKQKSKRLMEDGIVLDFNYLNKLELSIYMPRFPDEQNFLSRLTSLALLECRLNDDPMPILEKLLQLRELSLCLRSFCGRKMVCADGGLPQLRKLLLSGLLDLEEWIIEKVSMPLLHTLTIHNCQKLKQLPDGLRFICSLEKLNMDKEWKERLLKGEEEYYKVQQIPSVIFSYE